MYEPNCVPSVALRISLFYRDSSRWSPKRSPFTVGVCTYSGHSPSPLHYLEETSPPKAALRACGKEDPHAMSPHCGYRLHARRGGRDWRGEGGRPGSGSAACTVLHPPPAQATPGYGSGSCSDRGGSAASPWNAAAEPQGEGHREDQEEWEAALRWDLFPCCQDVPIWLPVRFQISLQAEKSTFAFLGNSFWCVPVGVSF